MKRHETPFASDDEAIEKLDAAKARGEWWKGRHEANDIYDPFWMKASDLPTPSTATRKPTLPKDVPRIRLDGSFTAEELLAFLHFHPQSKRRPRS